MCGILGIVARSPVNQLLYEGLLLLQHRGQDAAGIVTSERKTFHMHKGGGMVRDVFRTRNMRSLPGNVGIAHCRYPTSGMFLWRNQTLLELIEEHLPELDAGLRKLRPLVGARGSDREIAGIFPGLPRISIDFGIMEKISGLRLIPAHFGWDDIGTWAALERALPADAHGNICRGSHETLETNNCILYAQNATVATFGVTDLIVVEAYGKVLVCPKNRASDLKKLVKELAK